MNLRRAAISYLSLALALAAQACSSSQSSAPHPPPASTSSSVTFPLVASGSSHALPSVDGFVGSVTLPPGNVSAGTTLTIAATTTPPAGAPLTQSSQRRLQTGTLTVFFFLIFTPSSDVTFTTVPGFSIDLPPSVTTAGRQFFYAISDPTASDVPLQFRTEGPATVSAQTVTFAPSGTPLTLLAGLRYIFAFYATSQGPTPTPSSPPLLLYVANSNNTVTAYDLNADGDVAPARTIAGPHTGFNSPVDVTHDSSGNLYVANNSPTPDNLFSFVVFAPGASGDASPIRAVIGDITQLEQPYSIAVDAGGTVYIANVGEGLYGNGVTEYASGANGNAPPIRTIKAPSFAFDPGPLAIDPSGNLVVAQILSVPKILTFAPGATDYRFPLRTLTGDQTALNSYTGIAVDSTGKLYVAGYDPSRVTVFAAGANGNVAPVQRIEGPSTGLGLPGGIAVDGAGNIYVSDLNNKITVYAPGSDGDAHPIRTIKGPSTALNTPFGIDIGPR